MSLRVSSQPEIRLLPLCFPQRLGRRGEVRPGELAPSERGQASLHLASSLPPPTHPSFYFFPFPLSSTMSQAQFDKAVAIVGALPPTGDVKPSDDDKLTVSPTRPTSLLPPLLPSYIQASSVT